MDKNALKKQLTTKRLDHLGLPAGLCKKYRIAERIDELIPLADDDRTKSTHGQRIVAMILNSQGFSKSPLYMTETFYRDKPVELLIGKGLKAKHFNDDALGRTLDALHKYGTTKLFCSIAFDLAKVLNLLGSKLNLDTTSLALYGQYDTYDMEDAAKPMYGHAKDHRPDLKQIVVSFISTGPAGIPVWFESHDGNSSDKTSFHETIKEFDSFTQSLRDSESFLWVADSALYTAGKLQESGIQWLTHPPATYKQVKQFVAQPYSDFEWEELTKEYQSTPVKGPEGEHWHLILSGQRKKAALAFHCNRIYLHNPQRIDALMMIMTMSLLVYNLGQYQLRETLKAEDATVPNQLGKPIQQPTLCWIFIMLRGISCAYLEDEYVGVINIGEREANIINLMGEEVIEIYDMK